MPNYQNTKIYKIWSPNSEKVYVGATVQTLSKRMTAHRKISNNTQSKIIIDLGDAKIELIQEFPCNNKMESDKKEGEYIRSLDCVNKLIAGRTKQQNYIDNKKKLNDISKQYRDSNIEKIALQQKEYYQLNKQKIAIRGKEYRDKNKSYILEQAKLYREKNIKILAEKQRIIRAKAKFEKEYFNCFSL